MARKAYNESDIKLKVIEGLLEGLSLVKICEPKSMPDRKTVIRWMSDDTDFATRCARARAIIYDEEVHKTLEIADDPDIAPDDKRVRISTRQWMASKLLPKKYGDRIEMEHSGSIAQQTDEQISERFAALMEKAKQ